MGCAADAVIARAQRLLARPDAANAENEDEWTAEQLLRKLVALRNPPSATVASALQRRVVDGLLEVELSRLFQSYRRLSGIDDHAVLT